jgi:hypothetical protein
MRAQTRKWDYSALLEAANLAFETSHLLLLLLDRVKGPFESAHPAAESSLLGLESCTPGQQLGLSRTVVERVAAVDGEAGSYQAPSCSRCDWRSWA